MGLPGNLVSQGLSGDDGDFFADTLVGMEIRSQAGVVFLNDDLSGLLDGFGSYTTLWMLTQHISSVSIIAVTKHDRHHQFSTVIEGRGDAVRN